MIMFAYTECGLSIERFFELSWYEWSLEIEKVRIRKDRDFDIWEGQASLMRNFMALFANANRGKNTPPFKPTDFIRLSFDNIEEEKRGTEKLSPEQVQERFDQLKNRNGRQRTG